MSASQGSTPTPTPMKCEECGTPAVGSNEMYVHSRCHPNAPTWAVFLANGGMRIECSVCKRPVVSFKKVE